MITKTVTFTDDETGKFWHNEDDGELTEICRSGLLEYVHIPNHVREIDVIFHQTKPAGLTWFELHQAYTQTDSRRSDDLIRLKTSRTLTWLRNARQFMDKMWQLGFRYVTVEYAA